MSGWSRGLVSVSFLVLGGATAGLTWRADAPEEPPIAAVSAGEFAIAQLAAELGRSLAAARARATTLADTAALRTAISTDTATVRDLIQRDAALGVPETELLVLLIRDGAGAKILYAQPPGAEALRSVLGEAGPLLDVSGHRVAPWFVAKVRSRYPEHPDGLLAIGGVPIDMQGANDRLRGLSVGARITVGGAALVALGMAPGPDTRIVRSRVDLTAQLGMVGVAAEVMVAEGTNRHRLPIALGALALGVVGAVVFPLLRRRRPESQPPSRPATDFTATLIPGGADLDDGPTQPDAKDVTHDDIEIGAIVGEYRILERLGHGGMGVVYSAVHEVIGKKVAIKFLWGDFQLEPRIGERFVREAQAVNRVSHPGIVDIFSFGRLPSGRPYLVMELLAGENLKERLKHMPPLTYRETFRILGQICAAAGAAHDAGIVHRDLKPDNVFLQDVTGDVKILDFGVAKLIETGAGNQTRTGTSIGTPVYMSPEQCRGRRIDPRSDLYTIGVVMFRIFTGTLPFHGQSEFTVLQAHVKQRPPRPSDRAHVPPALEALILRCLAKKPEARPQSAAQLAAELEGVAKSMGDRLDDPSYQPMPMSEGNG
jgi:hypothetical protein